MNYRLNFEGFEADFVNFKPALDGVQYLFRFENYYGASVVKHSFSHGSAQDLWELAVIKFDKEYKWDLCYDTEITYDVEGYLTDENVRELLGRIKGL